MEASELNLILEQHQLWIETNGVQGKLANLTGANLSYANLRGAKLKDADLRRADLRRANLNGAEFHAANLTRASLTRANLNGAILTGAFLTGANLEDVSFINAYLEGANLEGANLTGANLTGAILRDADLTGAILPDISWIIPGCLVQLNRIKYEFYLEKEDKWENFIQDSFGFFIQNNGAEKTFDMLVEDRIIRNIPDWVKYSGLKKLDP